MRRLGIVIGRKQPLLYGESSDDCLREQPGRPRGFRLLEYLNTSPRVLYLAKLRNPNPRMPGADQITRFQEKEKGGPAANSTGAGDFSGGPR